MPRRCLINLFDSAFAGQSCSVFGKEARLVEYVRGQQRWDGITLFTDQWLYDPVVDQVESSLKVGWLIEGKELRPWYYRDIWQVAEKFDVILTYDQALIDRDPHKFRLAIKGGVWAPRSEWGMYAKTRDIAMIVSDKQETSGHKLRHEIVKRFPQGIDYYGPSFRPIGTNKRLAYQDYRYAIVVEAERSRNFFSEHLLDALAYGCIPIYWGCSNLSAFFDGRDLGIWRFETIDELADRISCAQPFLYLGNLEAIRWLRSLLPSFEITDDWIVSHPLKPYLGGQGL